MDELSKTYADLLGHSRKVLAEVADERETWKARAEAAERRVAELEARLAELDWRPVTEPPPIDDQYEVYSPTSWGVYQDMAWWDGKEWIADGEELHPTHWAKARPAPTPPPAATE